MPQILKLEDSLKRRKFIYPEKETFFLEIKKFIYYTLGVKKCGKK